ncbi:MAG: ATP-dependent helicase HrpB [Bacteroidaceae bacterium]|nr:ATP-dependent helicase HrpB [Bacteroidaceae bacterium]
MGNAEITEIAEKVNQALAEHQCLVVTAPPGAGKSTVLPLTILEGLKEGRILMLEPRRLAARQVAVRMSGQLGQQVGDTVGYRVRFENRVSEKTRIEVVTEGILTRMLIDDPTLDGVSVLIFDEFHERSLNSDSGLALVLEAQKTIRPDLRVVIMSATIDASEICSFLQAPHIEALGRQFPVQLIHSSEEADARNCVERVSAAIRVAFREHDGDILAFLPGQSEILKCRDLLLAGQELYAGNAHVYPLYGLQSVAEQQQAIAPCRNGERKIVLATPVAETSLTIEGVRVVVDSGLFRQVRFSAQTGLSQMTTERISLDMATQRAGRAGRLAPGVCYRLWSTATEHNMAGSRVPEILQADLTPLALEIAAWGNSDVAGMKWLTPPPAQTLCKAQELLRMLGATDGRNSITAHGRRLSGMPCHPRIAQMLVGAGSEQEKALAADIAAIIEEKDPMAELSEPELGTRLLALRRSRAHGGDGRWGRIMKVAEQYRRLSGASEDNSDPDVYVAGRLLAHAWPERVARARKDAHELWQMANGESVLLSSDSVLSAAEWVVAVNVSQNGGNSAGRVHLASAVDQKDLLPMTETYDNISWDSRQGRVVAERQSRIGRLTVESRPITDVAQERIHAVICDAARKEGLSMLDFNDDVRALQRRVASVALWHPELELPDLSDQAVQERVEEWLPFFLEHSTSVAQLKKIDLCQALWTLLDYNQQQSVERLAPTHVTVPTGSRIRIEYRTGADAPVLRVRLQECFGMASTPRVDDGRIPMLMELLSPGYKPVQLTSDLQSFWNDTYFEVRKELRRRYPKHSWPDNPLEAQAVRK